MLTLLFGLLISAPAHAQDMPLELLSEYETKFRVNVGRFKNLKCKKLITQEYNNSYQYEFYLVDGHAQCSEPVAEKFCKVIYSMKASEYKALYPEAFNLCKLSQNTFENGVHTLTFDKVYCPEISCHTSWLDLFTGFTMSNFRYNMGKYINLESDFN